MSREHGTRARYVMGEGPGKTAGCRCDACTAANRAYAAQRERQQAYGRWAPRVDAGPAKEHLRALSAAGIGWKRAAELSGVSTGAVSKLLFGGPGDRPPARRIRPETEQKLLAVPLAAPSLAAAAVVDATATRRRLQALVARGYSQAALAARLGIQRSNFGQAAAGKVTAATERAVSDLYDELWNVPPDESTHRARISVSRARSYAAARGWCPPRAGSARHECRSRRGPRTPPRSSLGKAAGTWPRAGWASPGTRWTRRWSARPRGQPSVRRAEMTVYDDNAGIPATVASGPVTHTSRWFHLTADTQDELHEFAAALGLQRSYFQPGTPAGNRPSVAWHYDVTSGKRLQALRMGACEIGLREMGELLRRRRAEQKARETTAPIPAESPALRSATWPAVPARHEDATPEALDRLAGQAWRAGEHGRALGLIGFGRLAFPQETARWDAREARVRAEVARQQREAAT